MMAAYLCIPPDVLKIVLCGSCVYRVTNVVRDTDYVDIKTKVAPIIWSLHLPHPVTQTLLKIQQKQCLDHFCHPVASLFFLSHRHSSCSISSFHLIGQYFVFLVSFFLSANLRHYRMQISILAAYTRTTSHPYSMSCVLWASSLLLFSSIHCCMCIIYI